MMASAPNPRYFQNRRSACPRRIWPLWRTEFEKRRHERITVHELFSICAHLYLHIADCFSSVSFLFSRSAIAFLSPHFTGARDLHEADQDCHEHELVGERVFHQCPESSRGGHMVETQSPRGGHFGREAEEQMSHDKQEQAAEQVFMEIERCRVSMLIQSCELMRSRRKT